MSIDMTTVTAITHNNKDVVKIEDSNGNVLWQKHSGGSGTLRISPSSVTNNTVEYGDDTTLKNAISASIGVPASSITITNKTYSAYVYRANTTTSRYYYRLNRANNSSTSYSLYTGSLSKSPLYAVVTFTTTTSFSTLYGFYGTTSSGATSKFNSNICYFPTGAYYEPNYYVDVDYEY